MPVLSRTLLALLLLLAALATPVSAAGDWYHNAALGGRPGTHALQMPPSGVLDVPIELHVVLWSSLCTRDLPYTMEARLLPGPGPGFAAGPTTTAWNATIVIPQGLHGTDVPDVLYGDAGTLHIEWDMARVPANASVTYSIETGPTALSMQQEDCTRVGSINQTLAFNVTAPRGSSGPADPATPRDAPAPLHDAGGDPASDAVDPVANGDARPTPLGLGAFAALALAAMACRRR